MNDTTATPANHNSGEVSTLQITYLLHALSPFTYWTLAVIAIIVGMVKQGAVKDSVLASHYAWLARTFWWSLAWVVLSWAVFFLLSLVTFGLGLLVFWIVPVGAYVVLLIWYLYRVIKGWLRLNDNLPMD